MFSLCFNHLANTEANVAVTGAITILKIYELSMSVKTTFIGMSPKKVTNPPITVKINSPIEVEPIHLIQKYFPFVKIFNLEREKILIKLPAKVARKLAKNTRGNLSKRNK